MLGGLLAALRPILAVVLLGSAATFMVAPAFDMANARLASRAASGNAAPLAHNTPTPDPEEGEPQPTDMPAPKVDFEALLRACLETGDPDSSECARAQEHSGLSYEDFRAKIVAKLGTPKPEAAKSPEPTKKPEPVVTKKPTAATSFDTLLKACIETRDPNSDACVRAGEASGLSAADWAAKVRAKIDAARQGEFATYFEKCLNTRDVSSDSCVRAEALSGLSHDAFVSKFHAKLAAKDGTDFWTVFNKCLDTRDVHSDVCRQAQSLIGFNDADFQAKFERYLAERTATAKPTATPKATVGYSLDTLIRMCGESRDRHSGACDAALVLSHLSPADFWAKIEAKYGRFD